MPAASSALPIYMQTAEMLIREIASGRLIDGERLPPERNMAADLGIAVGTLRKALDDLSAKGLLERVHGSGNYIRHNPDAQCHRRAPPEKTWRPAYLRKLGRRTLHPPPAACLGNACRHGGNLA